MQKKILRILHPRARKLFFFFVEKVRKFAYFLIQGTHDMADRGKKIYEGYQYVGYRMEEKKFYFHLHGSAALKPIVLSFCSFLLGGPCSRKRISGCFNTSWNNVPGENIWKYSGVPLGYSATVCRKNGRKIPGGEGVGPEVIFSQLFRSFEIVGEDCWWRVFEKCWFCKGISREVPRLFRVRKGVAQEFFGLWFL